MMTSMSVWSDMEWPIYVCFGVYLLVILPSFLIMSAQVCTLWRLSLRYSTCLLRCTLSLSFSSCLLRCSLSFCFSSCHDFLWLNYDYLNPTNFSGLVQIGIKRSQTENHENWSTLTRLVGGGKVFLIYLRKNHHANKLFTFLETLLQWATKLEKS